MRTALIPTGTGARPVTAIVMAGEDYAPPDGMVAVASDAANIGDLYDGGAFTPPASPAPTVGELVAYVESCMEALLGSVWTFDVAAAGQPAHTVTTRLDERGESRMHSIDRWSQEKAGVAGALLPYWGVIEAPTGLNPAEAAALASQALAVGVNAFTASIRTVEAITASPPTITERAQVEAVFAALKPAA